METIDEPKEKAVFYMQDSVTATFDRLQVETLFAEIIIGLPNIRIEQTAAVVTVFAGSKIWGKAGQKHVPTRPLAGRIGSSASRSTV